MFNVMFNLFKIINKDTRAISMDLVLMLSLLTHFMPLVYFCTPPPLPLRKHGIAGG